jgi:ABC-type amino acid transport substrate-binding protein
MLRHMSVNFPRPVLAALLTLACVACASQSPAALTSTKATDNMTAADYAGVWTGPDGELAELICWPFFGPLPQADLRC